MKAQNKKKNISHFSKSHQKVFKTNSLLNNPHRNDSLVEGLLGDIYDRFNISFKESFDSDVFTELSMSSSRFSASDSTADHESESKHSKDTKIAKSNLQHLSKNSQKI